MSVTHDYRDQLTRAARRNARIGASIGPGGTATGTITGLDGDKLHIRTAWESDITMDVKNVARQLAEGTYYLDTYPDGTPL